MVTPLIQKWTTKIETLFVNTLGSLLTPVARARTYRNVVSVKHTVFVAFWLILTLNISNLSLGFILQISQISASIFVYIYIFTKKSVAKAFLSSRNEGIFPNMWCACQESCCHLTWKFQISAQLVYCDCRLPGWNRDRNTVSHRYNGRATEP